jgi:hypothetical protein
MPLLGATGGGSAKGFGALANLGYFIKNSLRFRASAPAYLNRTPGTAGNRRTFTYSAWVKIGTIGTWKKMFSVWNANTDAGYFDFGINNNNTFTIQGWNTAWRITTQVFRDPSAWYHIVVAVDTTQATAANRIKLYVNGNQVTSFSSSSDPTQNYDFLLNSTVATYLGTDAGGVGTLNFDGYQTEINFIDGQALTPSSFGKTDAATGQWIPKKFAGTYGTNGFYLKFADASAATAAAIGKDSSPNGNNWTPNNISVTAGTTYDAMIDSPTLSAAASNYATLNPVYKNFSQPTISNGNLTQTPTTTAYQNAFSTIGVTSGKWYVEITMAGTPNSANYFGIANTTQLNYLATNSEVVGATTGIGYSYAVLNGQKYTNGGGATYGAALASGDVLGIAFDADAGTLTFYKNGSSQGTAFTGIDATTTYFFGGSVYSGGVTSVSYNFGQRPFAYTPPTGFKSLNAFNI